MLLPAAEGIGNSAVAGPDRATLARLAAPVAPAMAAVEERLAGLVPESVGGLAPVVYRQMLAAGGKRLRPLMLLLSCAAAGGDSLRGVSLAVAAEVLHLASLIHDDVIDESEQRRGRPSARQQWGNKAAVLVGDLLVAEVFHRLAEDLEHKSVALLAHTVGEMCCAELAHATDPRNLDEAAYRCNIRGKTAALMGTVCEVGALAAGNEAAAPALREFGRKLGEAFQITDDLLDLHGDAVTVGKPVQQDLRKGQWTLAVLHALGHGSPEDVCRLRDLLAQAPEDSEAARQAASLVGELGGRDYARQVAAGLASEAQAALQGLPSSPARGSLEGLARYAVQREC